MSETPITEIIRSSLENAKKIFDANTVVGEPISVGEGTVIIPVSKVTCGIATGGTDIGGKDASKGKNGFGGGGGTGLSVIPLAFLVVNSCGDVKLLNVGENSGFASGKVYDAIAAVDGIIDKAPGMVEKIGALFKKKDTEPEKGNKNGNEE